MAAGGERSGGTGSEDEARSGCGGVARHRKKACPHCRASGHGMVSLGEGRQRKMNAGKTSVGCSGDGWVESPGVHTPSPSTKERTELLFLDTEHISKNQWAKTHK